MLWAGRIIVIVISVVALLIAVNPNCAGIMALVECAWAAFGAAFGPAIILSLFWKRFTYKGAVAGILAGAGLDMIWLWLPVAGGQTLGAITGVYELLPAFIFGGVVAIIATLLDKKPSAEVEAIFERATDNSIDD